MRAVHLLNSVGLLVALSASLLGARGTGSGSTTTAPRTLSEVAAVEPVELNGARGLRDASGRFVPLKPYRRIVSMSSVTDSLLYALCEPDRVAAYSPYARQAYFSYRFTGRPQLADAENLEALLELKPDLLLANHLSRPDLIHHLRSSGLQIFDLGEMKGLSTLLPNIETVGVLLGEAERGRELRARTAFRMEHLHAGAPATAPLRAMYVGIHGDKIYGGAAGTSYHDVLTAAGLHDVAAERFSGWPRLTAEHLLQLDPDVLVTQDEMGAVLCRQPGLHQLRACNHEGRILELPTALLLSPGLEMVEAAETLHFMLQAGTKPPAP